MTDDRIIAKIERRGRFRWTAWAQAYPGAVGDFAMAWRPGAVQRKIKRKVKRTLRQREWSRARAHVDVTP